MEKDKKPVREFTVNEAEVDSFIRFNSKTCWESDFENGVMCISVKKLEEFLLKHQK